MKNLQDYLKLLLVALLGIWVVIVVYQWGTPEKQKRVPLTYTKDSLAIETNQKEGEVLTLRLDLLEKSREVKWRKPKNIFRPIKIYKPTTTTTLPPIPEVYLPSPEEIAAEKARQDLSRFKVLGFLNKGEYQEVFLSKDGELFIVRQGDMIQNRYRLKALYQEANREGVILLDPNTNVEVTIIGSTR